MNDPVVSQEVIDHQARTAAQAWAKGGPEPVNPFPEGSDAAALWKRRLEAWLLPFSQHAGEGIPC